MTLSIRPARRDDVAAIIGLYADDALGQGRETVSDPPLPGYLDAFDRVAADPRERLVVAEGAKGLVGTAHLSFLTGLSDRGAEIMLIRAVRIASSVRGQGLGGQLIGWCLDQARARGCSQAELFTHLSRADARRFYERLGFSMTHAGMRLRL